jgi:hypothetical protein
MNYTKGDWVVDYRGSIGHIKSVTEGSKPGVTPTPTVCRYDSMAISISEDEKKANANLISATPDLYECLIVAKSLGLTTIGHDSGLSHKEFCRMADSAIAKAEGREV